MNDEAATAHSEQRSAGDDFFASITTSPNRDFTEFLGQAAHPEERRELCARFRCCSLFWRDGDAERTLRMHEALERPAKSGNMRMRRRFFVAHNRCAAPQWQPLHATRLRVLCVDLPLALNMMSPIACS
ncbi:hypothetical protein RB195_006734 [Necator americanus]